MFTTNLTILTSLVTLATSTKVEPTGAFTDIRLAKGFGFFLERKQISSKGRERW